MATYLIMSTGNPLQRLFKGSEEEVKVLVDQMTRVFDVKFEYVEYKDAFEWASLSYK